MGVFSRDFWSSGNLNKIRGWLWKSNASEESRIWNYGKHNTYNYPQMEQIMDYCPGASGVILGDRFTRRQLGIYIHCTTKW